jgi:hypothetical protein
VSEPDELDAAGPPRRRRRWRWLVLLGIVVTVIGLGWLTVRAWRSSSRSPLDASTPPVPSLLAPSRQPVGVQSCDAYVAAACACSADAPALPGSAAARCNAAGLLGVTWRDQRAAGSVEPAELERRCQRLLEALPALEPACARPQDGGAPAPKVDK